MLDNSFGNRSFSTSVYLGFVLGPPRSVLSSLDPLLESLGFVLRPPGKLLAAYWGLLRRS